MLLAKNRKAYYNYEIIEKFLAGIKLLGYEVKAIREGRASFDGAYIQVVGDEAFVVNMYIGQYSKRGKKSDPEETRRSRKLLLKKNEIEKLKKEVVQKGKTAVPLALLLRNNLVKLELAIVKGRKRKSKKQLEKDRQIKKDLAKKRKSLGL